MGGAAVAQIDSSWTGDRMTFSFGVPGQTITGQLVVARDLVRIEVRLPGVLAVLAQAIQRRVQMQGPRLLERK